MSSTKRIGLEYLEVNQSQKEVTVNEALNRLDAFVSLTVEDILTSLPGSPEEGAAFLIAKSATGDWEGKDDQVAHYLNGGYEYCLPFEGLRAYVSSTGKEYRYVGSSWKEITVPPIQVVDAIPEIPVEGTVYLVKGGA